MGNAAEEGGRTRCVSKRAHDDRLGIDARRDCEHRSRHASTASLDKWIGNHAGRADVARTFLGRTPGSLVKHAIKVRGIIRPVVAHTKPRAQAKLRARERPGPWPPHRDNRRRCPVKEASRPIRGCPRLLRTVVADDDHRVRHLSKIRRVRHLARGRILTPVLRLASVPQRR